MLNRPNNVGQLWLQAQKAETFTRVCPLCTPLLKKYLMRWMSPGISAWLWPGLQVLTWHWLPAGVWPISDPANQHIWFKLKTFRVLFVTSFDVQTLEHAENKYHSLEEFFSPSPVPYTPPLPFAVLVIVRRDSKWNLFSVAMIHM